MASTLHPLAESVLSYHSASDSGKCENWSLCKLCYTTEHWWLPSKV